ncbi:UNVERIFIED_CONTAM: hypothetical protein FKN15_045775 [Acipenser sinensis]
MDPAGMSYLKEEPYFGMGRMAVSWHHDENLVDRSPVAVCSYSYEERSIINSLWKTKYSKLALMEAHSTPLELHGPVQTGLSSLLDHGCLFRDLVQMNTRLFTIRWPASGAGVKYCDDEVARACQAVKDLNDYLCVEAERCLTQREGAQSAAETTASVTKEKERSE